MKNFMAKFLLLLTFSTYWLSANASNIETENTERTKVLTTVKNVKLYVKKNGIEQGIIKFKNSKDIVIANYDGIFFISPLHPELIGKSQFNYKDPSGALVVQEEINKAKEGGGWLKGRWRKNPQTGEYVCRKIYIFPLPGNYFIGSWYHYASTKQGVCLN